MPNQNAVHDIIYERFIKPFEKKSAGVVGVEVEFPLVNIEACPVSLQVAEGLLEFMLQHGFHTVEHTLDGKPAFIQNNGGDVLSFDNSYNNFEFSMQYGDSLNNIAERFYKYYGLAKTYLERNGHTFAALGINPYHDKIQYAHVNYPVYNMVDSFLHNYGAGFKHKYNTFPSIISSTQTHLDVNIRDLPDAYTLFSRLDFVRALLFSNSPFPAEGKDVVCIRDFMWEKSAFGITGNVGQHDAPLHDLQDVYNMFYNSTMFNRKRGEVFETFSPVRLYDYFSDAQYQSMPQDIKNFLSFKSVEITCRGTLETRSDCTQPASDIFAPSAFALGALYNRNRISSAVDGFLLSNKIHLSNSELRKLAVSGNITSIAATRELSMFLLQIVGLAMDGLQSRGFGEEKYLFPILDRADRFMCPAEVIKRELRSGSDMRLILEMFGNVFWTPHR